jgi:hypothetical protein
VFELTTPSEDPFAFRTEMGLTVVIATVWLTVAPLFISSNHPPFIQTHFFLSASSPFALPFLLRLIVIKKEITRALSHNKQPTPQQPRQGQIRPLFGREKKPTT